MSIKEYNTFVVTGIALAGGDQNIEDSSNIAVEEEGIADIEDNLEETADNIEEVGNVTVRTAMLRAKISSN